MSTQKEFCFCGVYKTIEKIPLEPRTSWRHSSYCPHSTGYKHPYKVWFCKIGRKGNLILPTGADTPMRDAIGKAFLEVSGHESEFIFSGWDGELSEGERKVIEGDGSL